MPNWAHHGSAHGGPQHTACPAGLGALICPSLLWGVSEHPIAPTRLPQLPLDLLSLRADAAAHSTLSLTSTASHVCRGRLLGESGWVGAAARRLSLRAVWQSSRSWRSPLRLCRSLRPQPEAAAVNARRCARPPLPPLPRLTRGALFNYCFASAWPSPLLRGCLLAASACCCHRSSCRPLTLPRCSRSQQVHQPCLPPLHSM